MSASVGSAAEGPKQVSRSMVPDLARGILISSRLFRVTVLTGLAVGALFLVYAAPPAWMIAAVAVGALAVGILTQLPCNGLQKMLFETSCISRLVMGDKYNEIYETSRGVKIFLGSMPNRFSSDGERLAGKEDVKAVLSINEPWERKPVGLSLAYQEQDWTDLRVTYRQIDVLDHTVLSNEDLSRAARRIHNRVREGKNVLVHCRAGVGRSAMAVAAYLIKYKHMEVETACALIKKNRPISTIMKKKEALTTFKAFLDEQRAS